MVLKEIHLKMPLAYKISSWRILWFCLRSYFIYVLNVATCHSVPQFPGCVISSHLALFSLHTRVFTILAISVPRLVRLDLSPLFFLSRLSFHLSVSSVSGKTLRLREGEEPLACLVLWFCSCMHALVIVMNVDKHFLPVQLIFGKQCTVLYTSNAFCATEADTVKEPYSREQ